MTRLRNLILAAVAAVVLLAPGAHWVAAVLQREEPKSWLEGRSRPKLPTITGRVLAFPVVEVTAAHIAALGHGGFRS